MAGVGPRGTLQELVWGRVQTGSYSGVRTWWGLRVVSHQSPEEQSSGLALDRELPRNGSSGGRGDRPVLSQRTFLEHVRRLSRGARSGKAPTASLGLQPAGLHVLSESGGLSEPVWALAMTLQSGRGGPRGLAAAAMIPPCGWVGLKSPRAPVLVRASQGPWDLWPERPGGCG